MSEAVEAAGHGPVLSKLDNVKEKTGPVRAESGTDAIASESYEQDAPKGGWKAWLYVLATFFLFANAWGLTQTFGVFQEYYVQTLLHGTSASSISWIGSIQVFLVITTGVFTGPLFDAGHLRALLVAGCVLTVLGMATLSLATALWHAFLAQGLAVGLGGGLVYVPSLALISTVFPPGARPWAIGCASAGGSVGGIIYTFMLRDLIPAVGFAWAVRAVALVSLALSAAALLLLLLLLPRRARAAADAGSASPPPRRVMFDLRALREPGFVLFALALLLNYIAFYVPAFFLPTFATASLGQSRTFASTSLVYMSVGSLLGRTVPMLVAARVGPVPVYVVSTATAVVVLFAWTAVRSAAGVIAFAAVYGLVSGALVAAPSAAMSHPTLSPTLDIIGTRMGMCWLFGGIGVLIGSPSAGALVDLRPDHVDFRPAQAFAGAASSAALVCLIVPLIAVIRYERSRDH